MPSAAPAVPCTKKAISKHGGVATTAAKANPKVMDIRRILLEHLACRRIGCQEINSISRSC